MRWLGNWKVRGEKKDQIFFQRALVPGGEHIFLILKTPLPRSTHYKPKMKKTEIIKSAVFQIGFGAFSLFIWYILQEPKDALNAYPNPYPSMDYPEAQLFVNFLSWSTLMAGSGLLILGLAGIIRLLFFR